MGGTHIFRRVLSEDKFYCLIAGLDLTEVELNLMRQYYGLGHDQTIVSLFFGRDKEERLSRLFRRLMTKIIALEGA